MKILTLLLIASLAMPVSAQLSRTTHEKLVLFYGMLSVEKSTQPRRTFLLRALTEDLEQFEVSGMIHNYSIERTGPRTAKVSITEFKNAKPLEFDVDVEE